MLAGVRAMVVTDLDGTLLDGASQLPADNRAALETLGAEGIVRVIATGRSLWSAQRVVEHDWPVDYVAVSSGAGIVRWDSGTLLRNTPMAAPHTARVCALMEAMDLDFMVQAPVPDSHRFVYRRSGAANPDFERRVRRYEGWCEEAQANAGWSRPACHVVAVHPDGDEAHRAVRDELGEAFTVIRTTSPLDHQSVWIEVLPAAVSKSQASDWIAARHGLDPTDVTAVGNDTNDLDLLQWAGRSFVVGNAPASMRERWPAVASHADAGFAEVARKALAALE